MFQTIARYVDFKPHRTLTKGDKSKITRYHTRISRALERGYTPVKAKNDGRIALAHAAQGIRGLPGLRVALIKPTGDGFRTTIKPDGTILSINGKSGVSKVTLLADFFDADEYAAKDDAVILVADQLLQKAKKALGHKPQRCAVAFWGGENAWTEVSFLAELLVVDLSDYEDQRGYPADSVNFYWIKRTAKVLKVQQKLRDDRTIAAKKRNEKRKRSDI